jgi:hypothetical protein
MMPNWKRIQKLLDYEESRPKRKFNMFDYIIADTDLRSITIDNLRKNECGSACCLFGDALVLLGPKNTRLHRNSEGPEMDVYYADSPLGIFGLARNLLGLTVNEADHMSMGAWSEKSIGELTRRHAIKYLRKAIAERNIMVTIDG